MASSICLWGVALLHGADLHFEWSEICEIQDGSQDGRQIRKLVITYLEFNLDQ